MKPVVFIVVLIALGGCFDSRKRIEIIPIGDLSKTHTQSISVPTEYGHLVVAPPANYNPKNVKFSVTLTGADMKAAHFAGTIGDLRETNWLKNHGHPVSYMLNCPIGSKVYPSRISLSVGNVDVSAEEWPAGFDLFMYCPLNY